MQFETTHVDHPFSVEDQIQPCSIDIRLSNVFWTSRNNKTLDLLRYNLLRLSPRSIWKSKTLGKGEYILLKPSEFLLGCTYEKFTMPVDCAGCCVARSSYSRLGLIINCSGNIIPPGYRGHGPIQLFNMSPNPIKIYPYLPIGQIIITKLSENPDKLYGEDEIYHKYMDDDGGPSYWWRDKRIESLKSSLKEINVPLNIQEKIIKKIGTDDPDLLERIEHYAQILLLNDKFSNEDEFMEGFIKSEKRKELRQKIILRSFNGAFPLFFTISCSMCFSSNVNNLAFFISWSLTILSLIPFIISLNHTKVKYFTN